MLSPIPLAEVWKFLLDSPLQVLGYFTRLDLRLARKMEMNVVGTHMPIQDCYISGFTTMPDELAGTQRDISLKNCLAILCHPYKMVSDVMDSVGSMTVFFAHGFFLP